MAKYIDREALIAWIKRIPLKDLSEGRGLCRIIMEEDFKHAIRTLPGGAVIDAAPVVHGEWIPVSDGETAECSECGENYEVSDNGGMTAFKLFCGCYKFCPNCGAKMEVDNG